MSKVIQNNKFKIKPSRSGRIIAGGIFTLVGITTLAGVILSNTTGAEYIGLSKASAIISASKKSITSVEVADSCTFKDDADDDEETETAVQVATGTYNGSVKQTTITVICNDPDGYDVYAVGYSNDTSGKPVEGNTNMVHLADSTITFPTGLSTSGLVSNWSMKLAQTGDYAPTILSDSEGPFTNYHTIPSTVTKIAKYSSVADATLGSSFTTTYAAYITYGQAAGTYQGKVKYTLSHPGNTGIYMQDLNSVSIAALLPNEHDVATVYDKRDGKAYTIAKLKDGKYWMTTNLNLAGGTKLYSDTSNVPSGYPSTGDTPYYTLPESSMSGFSDNTVAYVYNTGNETADQADCTGAKPCNSYYSWLAATAGSGSNIETANTNAGYSICPKGWRLPTAGSSAPYTNWDFYNLAVAYGMSADAISQSTSAFYDQAGPGTIPNFLTSGNIVGGIHYNGGSYGFYWSITSSENYSNTNAHILCLNTSKSIQDHCIVLPQSVNSAGHSARYNGMPVRCLFAG